MLHAAECSFRRETRVLTRKAAAPEVVFDQLKV
jgi:hypothetical protein